MQFLNCPFSDDRQLPPYRNPTFKEDHAKIPVPSRGRSGKDPEPDEMGEADYSPLQGKHQKPYSSGTGSDMQDWRLDEAPKSKCIYNNLCSDMTRYRCIDFCFPLICHSFWFQFFKYIFIIRFWFFVRAPCFRKLRSRL